ncbi:MAG: thiamine phosphate synthase [Pseudomonadota bacterium]|nr:thiamine phosphate synthase [Pseudomonadota bacterium]
MTNLTVLHSALAGVYLLTPDAASFGFNNVLKVVGHALNAGVRAVQYRDKGADPASRLDRAQQLMALTHSAAALLIVNDSVEVAAASGADGLHLGRDDGDLSVARRRLPNRILGVSCYDQLEAARAAIAAGADVIAFGSMFASSTKPTAVRAPLTLLSQARSNWPHQRIVAIGGINRGNIAAVARAGAHAAAVLDAVFGASNPALAARELVQGFNEGRHEHDEQRTTV